jgi:CBS domain-containing protein
MQADTMHGSYLMPSLENATVSDAMHPGVMTCEPDATVTDVARAMATNHIHCLAVAGAEAQQGDSPDWGIISDLDLIRAGVDAPDQTAAGIASPVVTVEPRTPLTEAARLMLTHRASHLLVVDAAKRRPIGILSTLDIAGVLAWGEA